MENDERILSEVESAVGTPPRRFSKLVRKYGKPSRPRFANRQPQVAAIYDAYSDTLKRGEVRWGVFLHANFSLYEPAPSDSRGQIVYSDSPMPLAELAHIAQSTASLKGTAPVETELRRVADMLTSEVAEAIDWILPASLTGDVRIFTTIVEVHRVNIPGGLLGLNYLPVLADPNTRYAAVVPAEYWPQPLIDWWLKGVRSRLDRLADLDVVTLTPFAAETVGLIAQDQQIDDFFFCVAVTPSGDGFQYKLDLKAGRPEPAHYEVRSQHGVTIAVPRTDVFCLRGCEIDYRHEQSGGTGFLINNPRVSR